MGFLAPAMLVALAAAAVPIVLHLFQRHESRRVSFPALRYLQRTEREHSRRIRLRQWLLLVTRVVMVAAVVGAAARLVVPGRGVGHDPTALAIVLDNSASSGLVVGDQRVLDRLVRLALDGLAAADDDDLIWVIRAGEPWEFAPPGGPAEARDRVGSTRVSAAGADLDEALARARALVRSVAYPAREIHLLSDLQASAFSEPVEPDEPLVPTLVLTAASETADNHYVQAVSVGGGLAPVVGQQSGVSVIVGASGTAGDQEIALRLVIDERIRGAASARAGRAVVLPLAPLPEGHVEGVVETDPDALAVDDRRFFAFRVRPAPRVALSGPSTLFLDETLAVLEESGRIVRSPLGSAEVLVSVGGEGLDAAGPGVVTVVLPTSDETLLPALNRRLSAAGIGWRAERPGSSGETELQAARLPVDMSGVRVTDPWNLAATPEGLEDQVPVRLATGEPWMVTGGTERNDWVLIASPLDDASTSLPLSAAMVPLFEWLLTRWSRTSDGGSPREAGRELSLPPAATHVRTPDGTLHAVDASRSFRSTREAGIYEAVGPDGPIERFAVNAPGRESLLQPIETPELQRRLGASLRAVDDPRDWSRTVFTSRQGPEPWRQLLVLALALMLLETWIAAPGRLSSTRLTPRPEEKDVAATI